MRVWFIFFFKQKTAYEMRIRDWSSDVCSSDLCWPRSDWSRASRYTVVLRQSESAACGGRTEANHRIHASFIEQTPCCVAPAGTTGSRGIGVANGHGVLGRAAALWRFSPGSEDRRTAVRAGPAGNVRQEKVAAR